MAHLGIFFLNFLIFFAIDQSYFLFSCGVSWVYLAPFLVSSPSHCSLISLLFLGRSVSSCLSRGILLLINPVFLVLPVFHVLFPFLLYSFHIIAHLHNCPICAYVPSLIWLSQWFCYWLILLSVCFMCSVVWYCYLLFYLSYIIGHINFRSISECLFILISQWFCCWSILLSLCLFLVFVVLLPFYYTIPILLHTIYLSTDLFFSWVSSLILFSWWFCYWLILLSVSCVCGFVTF